MKMVIIRTGNNELEYGEELDSLMIEFKINESDSLLVLCTQNGIEIGSNLKQPKILPLDSFKFIVEPTDER